MDFIKKAVGGSGGNDQQGQQGYGNQQGGYGGEQQGYGGNQGGYGGNQGGYGGNQGGYGGNQGGYGNEQTEQKQGGGGFLGSIGDKFNSAAGGGRESEKNEDYLDKGMSHNVRRSQPLLINRDSGVDFVQERFMGGGPQNNESAIEQAKDEQISDFIRGQYKSTMGKDMPIKDKETRFG